MTLLLRLLFFATLASLLTACGGGYHATQPSTVSASSSLVSEQLYSQHQEWQGTPYRYGGLDKAGIDCSGFVYLTFKQRFDFGFPRTTQDQVTQGKKIAKYDLQSGDLVFFKTGWKVRHVGIYIENGQFLHASKSKGVIISSLENVYWKKAYWQSRRVLYP
ncbi:MAG: hypothetical protein COA90_07245 [Gammaproteobacteria bacterium]|nr:MAG: hypothetical protein COA90_07245 [Gammaproteobacteria bacterium]